MMLRFIDPPIQYPLDRYRRTIERMVEWAEMHPEIEAVYQIGGVSTPGISDLDIVFILQRGSVCKHDPLEKIPVVDRYLFAHPPFAAPAEYFNELQCMSPHVTFRYLAGSDPEAAGSVLSDTEKDILAKQTAKEYLIKNCLSHSFQIHSGIIKMRSFLLEIKAVEADRRILADGDLDSGPLNRALELRSSWFQECDRSTVDIREVLLASIDFEYALLGRALERNPLHVPEIRKYTLSRIGSLRPDSRFNIIRYGLFRPAYMPPTRFLLKILSRTSRVSLGLPMSACEEDHPVSRRNRLDTEILRGISSRFPSAVPMTASILARAWEPMYSISEAVLQKA